MLSQKQANGLLMSTIILCLGLGASVFFLWHRSSDPKAALDLALGDPELRKEIVSELVNMTYSAYDSHPDADIGRLFQPDISRKQGNLGTIITNRWGLREKDFALPKNPGTLRVILLGDSYVFGNMVEMDERFGVHLEQYLIDHATSGTKRIECLHIGIPSWNILSECAYARRLITDLQPDLLIQVVVPNDLDDLEGVRGFGALARFSPQHRERGSSMVGRSMARGAGFRPHKHYLMEGRDAESRDYYRQAHEAILDLATVVENTGGKYLLLLNWMSKLPVGQKLLTPGLAEDQVAMLPFSLFRDLTMKIAKNNGHWNPAGHEHVARYLYAIIQQNNLIPELGLTSWDQANAVHSSLSADVAVELTAKAGPLPPNSTLDFRNWNRGTAEQIYGGVFKSAVGPYASVVLATNGGGTFHIEAQFIDSPIMKGATVRILVEGREVAALPYQPGKAFNLDRTLPTDLSSLPVVNVRLITDEYVLMGQDRRETVSLMVNLIAIRP